MQGLWDHEEQGWLVLPACSSLTKDQLNLSMLAEFFVQALQAHGSLHGQGHNGCYGQNMNMPKAFLMSPCKTGDPSAAAGLPLQ